MPNKGKFNLFVAGVRPHLPVELPEAFNNAFIVETRKLKNPSFMEVIFWNEDIQRPSLVLNRGAPDRASVIERSLLIGAQKGIKPLDENYSINSDFLRLPCDTLGLGADLGVEHDVQINGTLWVDSIKESGVNAGLDIEVDGGMKIKSDAAMEIEFPTLKLPGFAGGGNRSLMVDNDGIIYAS